MRRFHMAKQCFSTLHTWTKRLLQVRRVGAATNEPQLYFIIVILFITALTALTALIKNVTLIPSTVQADRQASLQTSFQITNTTTCPTQYLLTQPFATNIIVSEANKLIFCPIPKAASSNWKYLIRKIEGCPDFQNLASAHSPNTSGLRYLTDYSPSEAHKILNDPSYFKFAFVRDPYLRLLSCYMDKFRNQDVNYTNSEYRAFLASAFTWPYARSIDPVTAPRPSFRTFVNTIIRHDPAHMNHHWKPQTLLCGFGLMPYDFVGRMEHLSNHSLHVLRVLKLDHDHFPTQSELGFPPSGASRKLASLLYSTDLMFKVRALYAVDFDILGYD